MIFHRVSGIQNLSTFEIWAQGAIMKAFSPQTEQLLCVTTGFAAGKRRIPWVSRHAKINYFHGNNNNHGAP